MSASVLAPPAAVRTTDGRLHLLYEILLQSTADAEGVSVDVQSLTVREKRGRALLRLSGAEISTVMTTISQQPTTSLAGAKEAGSGWISRCGAAARSRAR